MFVLHGLFKLESQEATFPPERESTAPHGALAAGRELCPSLCLSVATTEAASPACQGSLLPTDQNSLAASSPLGEGQQSACPVEEP